MEIYFAGNKKVYASVNGFTVMTDQAVSSGGDGEYPEPFTLFLTSLGTCAGIYTKSFCDQRGIPTENIQLIMEERYDPEKKIIGFIEITIHAPADFPEKYEGALIHTASLCAVKRHLREDIEVMVRIVKH